MTGPAVPPGKRKKKQTTSEEDELMNEIYGPGGSSLRKMAAAPHKYGKPKVQTDSTMGSKVVARVKRFLGRS